jgi:rod shape-determining protein MreD
MTSILRGNDKNWRGYVKLYLKLISTVLLAMMLAIFPLPEWINWLRPLWVVMLLIYWVLVMPQHISVGFAWIIGLLLDVLMDTVLGAHALALVIFVYLITKFSHRILLFSIWRQALAVFIIIILYQAILFWIQAMVSSMVITWQYWLPSLTSAIFWPVVYILMQKVYREKR